jgi:prepilin-type processing-associated H-X9-DG protein
LLITLAVVSLLLALLAPGVASLRESSRRTQCTNNLRQMIIAAASYESRYHVWPPSTIPHFSGRRGTPGWTLHYQNLSLHARLLPDLDQEALFAQIDTSEVGRGQRFLPPTSNRNTAMLGHRIKTFECPSDSVPPGGSSYRVCAAAVPFGQKPKIQLWSGIRDLDWRDGRAQTVVLSERATGDMDASRYTPDRDIALMGMGTGLTTVDDLVNVCRRNGGAPIDHSSNLGATWLFSGYPQTWYNHVLTPNSRIPDCVGDFDRQLDFYDSRGRLAVSARSYHPGGVNVGFADGTVRFMSQAIDLALWRALATRDGGEVVSSP